MTVTKLGIGSSARIVGNLGEGGGLVGTCDAKGRMESCNLTGSPTHNTMHGTYWCSMTFC